MGVKNSRSRTTKSTRRIPIDLTVEPFSPLNPMPGVCWDDCRKKWKAQATWKAKKYNLGRYDHYDDAVEAVIEFRVDHPKYDS